MALVQVKEVFRSGLVQKVARYVSPPNPSSPTSFLWRADSFSMQRRALLMARMTEFKTTFFSGTPVATPPAEAAAAVGIHTSSVVGEAAELQEEAKSDVTSAGTSSSEVDSVLLDRDYGQEQADHHKVAESAHDQHTAALDEEQPETLEATEFDISKMTRPAGGE